jgi:GNAT superfamily N-acetyltransferase
MNYSIKRLTPDLVSSFYQLHCEKNGEGWCICVAWWVPTWEGWTNRTAEQNRALRDELFAKGEYDGYLFFDEKTSIGWLQCGPRDRLNKLTHQLNLQPDPQTWAISCILLAPSHRGKGLTHDFLKQTLQDLRTRGVTRVEAYPKKKDSWTGPESAYKKAGFTLLRADEPNSIYELTL